MGTFVATNGILKIRFTNLTIAILKNLEFFLKFRQIFLSLSGFSRFLSLLNGNKIGNLCSNFLCFVNFNHILSI